MQCNHFPNAFVQWSNLWRSAVTALLVVGLSPVAADLSRADSAGPAAALNLASAAAQQVQSGDAAAAAVTLRQALDADPGNTLLHNFAASLLVLTGDPDGASIEWKRVLVDTPGDPLAVYGLGLVSLSKGDRARALDRFQVASGTGDRSACLLASRYVEFLDGAKGAGAGLALPDSFAATTHGLSGMAASKMGDSRRAMAELSAAVTALPGDPFSEPFGLLMTFRPASPISAGSIHLPAGNGLVDRRSPTNEKVYSGVITLKPDSVDSDTGYVTFRIDGNVSSIANTSPFSLVWDTAKVPNGLHKVEMTVFDRRGDVVTRADKELRTSNQDAPTVSPRDPEVQRATQDIRAALWRALLLLPSREAMAAAAANAARTLGDKDSESRYVAIAAALSPTTAGSRAKWLVSQGEAADPPLFRGAPADPTIALTFDDGPKPGVTELLVNVLKQEGIPATFFVIGRHAAEYPNLVKLIVDSGFEIENHTYTHSNLTLLSPASIEKELLRTIAAVQAATGKRMRYFRPPGGNLSPDVTKVAAKWGLTPCMWTVTADSLEYGNGDQLVDFVVKHAQPGGIIILHNGRMTTVESLPRIVAGLRQRGFRFETIEQMAQRKAALARTTTPASAAVTH